jgi:hypothetical protein
MQSSCVREVGASASSLSPRIVAALAEGAAALVDEAAVTDPRRPLAHAE